MLYPIIYSWLYMYMYMYMLSNRPSVNYIDSKHARVYMYMSYWVKGKREDKHISNISTSMLHFLVFF